MDTTNHWRSGGVVTEDITHVVEQPCGRQHNRGRVLLATIDTVHEHSRVDMSAVVRFCEPLIGGICILRNALAHEVQLSQQILCVGISVVRGLPQVFCCRRSILWRIFTAEIFFSQSIGGVVVAVIGRAFQPIDALDRIVNVGIIGEIQLAQCILRRVDFLLGSAFQQLLRFGGDRYQQPTVAVRRADDVLCVSIACIRKLFQLLRCFVPLL